MFKYIVYANGEAHSIIRTSNANKANEYARTLDSNKGFAEFYNSSMYRGIVEGTLQKPRNFKEVANKVIKTV